MLFSYNMKLVLMRRCVLAARRTGPDAGLRLRNDRQVIESNKSKRRYTEDRSSWWLQCACSVLVRLAPVGDDGELREDPAWALNVDVRVAGNTYCLKRSVR